MWKLGRWWKARTENMLFILVTLEVSKCSGWLNDDAPCKAGRRAHYIRCRARCPGVERVGREGVWGGAERRESRDGRSARRTWPTCL